MRKAKLEIDRKLKNQVITRLAQGEKQWDIARSVGLDQAQISRFAAKYKKRIELKRRDLEFKRDLRIVTMAFKMVQPPSVPAP